MPGSTCPHLGPHTCSRTHPRKHTRRPRPAPAHTPAPRLSPLALPGVLGVLVPLSGSCVPAPPAPPLALPGVLGVLGPLSGCCAPAPPAPAPAPCTLPACCRENWTMSLHGAHRGGGECEAAQVRQACVHRVGCRPGTRGVGCRPGTRGSLGVGPGAGQCQALRGFRWVSSMPVWSCRPACLYGAVDQHACMEL